MDYESFLCAKKTLAEPSGFECEIESINPMLFDWQRVLVRWALGKGRCAIFADCGLGKTPIQLVWADHVYRHTGIDVLILAPLAVSRQTKREGQKFSVEVNICRGQEDVKPGINIANYERLHRFDASKFGAVVLDESSIMKNFAGKTRNQIIDMFRSTPYKLCCTATPAPNDYPELGSHCEFLGVMTRSEMLSMFFINDTGDTGKWRLKGHVAENKFWEWLCSWAVMIRKPSDIGFDDGEFILPPLNIIEHRVKYDGPTYSLFVEPARTLTERRQARKESLADRISAASEIIKSSDQIWLVWCNLNAESEGMAASVPGAVEVTGSDSPEHKETSMLTFSGGQIRCLVSKPKIAGFGMNWQNCNNMVFVGLSDSYEQFYQSVRRCWRFGQKKAVNAHIVIGEREGAVVENIKRKERDMAAMFDGMVRHMADIMKQEIRKTEREQTDYNPTVEMKLPKFLEEAA
jgi:hypothetical protein